MFYSLYVGMKQTLQSMDSCKSEALLIANIAKSIRDAIFKQDGYHFSGAFPPHCQQDCIPYNLKLLISMSWYGSSLKSEETVNSQACLTAAQIILFNTKKDQPKAKSRHSLDRELPLPVYLGLNVHSVTRSKKLIDQLHDLHIGISYEPSYRENGMISYVMQEMLKSSLTFSPTN